MLKRQIEEEITAGKYRNYNGYVVVVLCVAAHTEADYKLVVYHKDGETDMKASPEAVFRESVSNCGAQVPRFTRIKECEAKAVESAPQ